MTLDNDLIGRFIKDGRGRHTFGSDGKLFAERFGDGEGLKLIAKYSSITDAVHDLYVEAMGSIELALQEPSGPPSASKALFEFGCFNSQQSALAHLFENYTIPAEDRLLAGQLRSQYRD